MPRRHSSISPPVNRTRLDRQLAGCAAIAAGLAVLGAADRSEAAVVYSGTTNLAVPTDSINDGFGTTDGLFLNLETGVSGTTAASVPGWDIHINNRLGSNTTVLQAAVSGAMAVSTSSSAPFYVSKLAAGVTVGPTSSLKAGFLYFNYRFGGNTYSSTWTGGVNGGFMGLSFTAGDGTVHDAWLRLNVSDSNYAATVVDWAYDSTPNTAVVTGVTSSAVPEPASVATLGVLALGAVGVRRNRRKID